MALTKRKMKPGRKCARRVRSLREALDRTRKDYKRLFDIVPCYITVQDSEFRILQSNALFKEDFGKNARAHCYLVYKRRDTVCPDCPVAKTFADGQVHSSEEDVIMRDGRRASTIVYSMPVKDERGRTQAVMEMSTNITEVKRLQRQLAMMGSAVAGMAHRIKNILMGLEGGVFVANTGFENHDPAAIDQGWQMVQRNVAKVSRIAKDLLYCAKEREPNLEAGVDPGLVVRETFDLYEPRARAEGISMRLEAQAIPAGSYDRESLSTVATNLVVNALDACRFDRDAERKEHVIVLRCRAQPRGGAVIEVCDNGGGMPDEVSHRLFQGQFSTKGGEGTGLGLLVIQNAAEQHGGSVAFSTKEGCGTTFTATLFSGGVRRPERASGRRSPISPRLGRPSR